MNKEQAAEEFVKGYIDTILTRTVKAAVIYGWEANEVKNQSDAVAFAQWLYENRWFYFDRSTQKWHYTFEQGTSIPKKTYEKLYIKTTAELYKLFNPSGVSSIPINCYHAECPKCGEKVDIIPPMGTNFIPQAAGPVWVKMELTIPNDWENEIIRSIGHKLTHDTTFWSRTKDGFHDDHTGNKYKASELEWLCEERISLNLLLRTVVRKAWLGNYQLNTLSDDITIDENFVFTEADKWFDSNFENIATTPLGLFALEDMKKAFDAGYDHGDPQNVWSLDFEGFMKTDFPNSKT